MDTKKIAIILAIIVVVISVFAYYFLLPKEQKVSQFPVSGTPELKTGEVTPPPATGNIDDIINSLTKELSDESSVLSAEEGDTSLLEGDSREVDDFGQSVDENEL